MKQIIKNRDNKGRILTYSVKDDAGFNIEYNTLKEAKIFAVNTDDINELKKVFPRRFK
jgi:hypothetical protein